ncbi:MAG: c-type cytochrome domain-containing protein [Deltaproteobacteria bacterium]
MSKRFVIPIALALGACSGVEPGTEGADCPNDNNCRPGLFCDDGTCALRPRDAGVVAPRDGGFRDAGRDAGPRDAGPRDAGPRDAGCPVPPQLSAIQTAIFGRQQQPACNQSTCHGASAQAGIRLDTPLAELHATLLGPTVAGQAPEPNIVVPGEPENSRLMTIISNEVPGGGGGRMPPANPPLDACSIETIRVWIENGAPQ